MVALGVREVEFYRQLTGAVYPREYGERLSARKRGLAFEANLHRDNALLLRRAVAPCAGLDANRMSVLNLDDAVGTDQAARLRYTRELLIDHAAGKPVPDLVIQPQLEPPIGPGYAIGIRPDVLLLDPSTRMYTCCELKSFIVRLGVADKSDLAGTRLQAAIEIEALRAEAALVGLGDRVRNQAVFVFATPYGLQPHPGFVERLDGPIREVRRALAALAVVKAYLDSLDIADSSQLAQLNPTLTFNFQEACVGTCVLADVCKSRVRERARSLGDAAVEYMGAETTLDRIEELLLGAVPVNAFEAELANMLIASAHMLGFDAASSERSV